jgi:hypothetical protein
MLTSHNPLSATRSTTPPTDIPMCRNSSAVRTDCAASGASEWERMQIDIALRPRSDVSVRLMAQEREPSGSWPRVESTTETGIGHSESGCIATPAVPSSVSLNGGTSNLPFALICRGGEAPPIGSKIAAYIQCTLRSKARRPFRSCFRGVQQKATRSEIVKLFQAMVRDCLNAILRDFFFSRTQRGSIFPKSLKCKSSMVHNFETGLSTTNPEFPKGR